MELKNYDDLNEIQLDALKEIGNIGTGNAASALSSMLDREVNISVPKINILEYDTVVKQMGGPEELMVGILFSLSGDVTGMMMFLLQRGFANMLLSELTESALIEGDEINDFDKSAIQEVGNIMAASYVNALAELTNLNINLSVPSLCIDMVGSIMSVPAIYYADISEKIIFIEDEFKNPSQDQATSYILMIPEVASLQKIMKSIGLDE